MKTYIIVLLTCSFWSLSTWAQTNEKTVNLYDQLSAYQISKKGLPKVSEISAEEDSILRLKKSLESKIRDKAPVRRKIVPIKTQQPKQQLIPIKKHKIRSSPTVTSTISGQNVTLIKDNPKARAEFELLKTRDPKTGSIPKNIRLKELDFMKIQNQKIGIPLATGDLVLPWYNRGPHNVGGRTRALAVDVNDENIILAGGVSGGMWRSIDQGLNWSKTTGSNELQSVTCIAQDTRAGQTDIWYYGTGEISGNSASGVNAFYNGDGIYKSTDGGQSWALLSSTSTGTPESFDQGFDFNYEIVVNPVNGNVLVANYFGVYESTDGGTSFSLVLEKTGTNTGRWVDIIMTSAGMAYAVIDEKGVFSSVDGTNWVDITPSSNFPLVDDERKELALAPSNENVFYLLGENASDASGHSLWKFDDSSDTWTDLSANIPQLGGVTGDFDSQGGYDLLIKVKSDNENFVVIGGTNLFASSDGFSSTNNTSWIGGYTPTNASFGLYSNHHPDQHSFVFLSGDKALSGNDGGVQITNDITDIVTNGNSETVDWTSLNNGYLTTQVYALSAGPGDQIMAGFQDNSTWLTTSQTADADWTDQFGGDGAYNAFNSDGSIRYMSSQNGNIFRVNYTGGADDIVADGFTEFAPSGYTAGLFIVPFYLDPINEDLFYLAGSSTFYVNTQASTGSSSIGWKTIELGAAGVISEIGVTSNNLVYLGTSAGEVFKVENPGGTETVTNVTGSNFPNGYVSGLGVNQLNADELVITFSNYSVQSVFYSADGGSNWSNVSGNLEENLDGSGSGPSVRTTQILGNGNRYFVGTSTGLYSTTSLNGGDATVWTQEDGNGIGDVVVEHLITKPENGLVVAGTHGNGIYSAQYEVSGQPENDLAIVDFLEPFDLVSGEESISVIVQNLGTLAQSSFDMTYFVNNVEVSTQTVTQSLNAGDSLDFTFATDFDFSAEGEYDIRVEVSLASDEVTGNNSKSKFVVNAMFTGTYVLKQTAPTTSGISAGSANGYLFSPTGTDVITLFYVDANTRGAYGTYLPDFHNNVKFYEWSLNNGDVIFSDNQGTGIGCGNEILLGTADIPGAYTIGDDTEFTLTLKEDVTDDCGGGSTDVTFLVTKQLENDLALTSIISPSEQELNNTYSVTIAILNTGATPQSNFEVSYFVNNELVTTEIIIETIESGASLEHTFSTQYNFNAAGNYEIKATVNLAGDENASNNELTKTTEITQLLGFEGPYSLEQLEVTTTGTSANLSNGYLFNSTGTSSVYIENLGGGERQFSEIYLPAFNSAARDYRFFLDGTQTVFDDNQETGIQCNNGILLGTADTQGSFDINDDNVFTLNIREDVTDDCGSGSVDVAFSLTRIPDYHDLSVVDVIIPSVFPNTLQNIQAAIFNFGNVPEDNFEVTYYVNDVAAATEVYSGGIDPNETVFFTFQTQYDFSVPGLYDIRIETNLSNDEFTDNDSHVVTVESLAPISTYPYLESFEENGDALPIGWDDFGNWSLSMTSSQTSTGPSVDNTTGTGYYAFADGQNSTLQTRAIDLTNLNSPLLSFYYHMFGTSKSVLDVRVNNRPVLSISGEQQQNQIDSYIKASVNLAQFAGQIVNIQFVANHSGLTSEFIAIDDVSLEEAVDHDLMVRNIMSPVNIVTGEEAISVTIENIGNRAQSEFDVSYYVDDVKISTEIFADIINSGQKLNFTFDTKFDFSTPDDYDIRVEVDLPTDEVTDNNDFSRQVSSIVVEDPPFSGRYQIEQLQQTTTSVSGSFANGYLFSGTDISNVQIGYIDENTRSISLAYLTEFGSPFRDYLFTLSNGEVVFLDNQLTDQACGSGILLGTADSSGAYTPGDDNEFTLHIREDVSNDCGTGTVDVSFRLTKLGSSFEYDLEVVSINNPVQNIPLSEQAVGFSIQNVGVLPQGDFDATYFVNDVEVATETFPQLFALQAGFTNNFTFATTYDFNTLDVYDIKVVLSRAADDNPLNDEFSVQVQTSAFNINAVPINNSRVAVEWINLADISSATLERSLDGSNFEDLVSVSTTDTNFIDETADSDIVYYYRLRGDLLAGGTSYSAIVSVQATIEGDYAFHKVLGDVTGIDLSNNTYSGSWSDLDADGDLDLVASNIPNFNPNLSIPDAPTVYLNDGEGNFEKAVNSTIVNDGVSSRSASIIDYDNDGKPDVFLSALNSRVLNFNNRLFKNNGNLDFTSIEIPDLTIDKNFSTEEAAWGDMDNDGDLDLFIAGSMFAGNENFLYENLGDGRFESIKSGVIYETLYNSGLYAWTASWVDYDGDGDQDLFVPDDLSLSGPKMFRNLGNGTFENDTENNIVSENKPVRGFQWVDFDQNGSLDLMMIDRTAFPIFFFNDGAGNFIKKTSIEVLGDELRIHRISTVGDINNNGKLDIIFASGGYFVYESNNDQTFTLLENVLPEIERGIFAGVSLADMDNDGDLDMYRGNASSGYSFGVLYENQGNSNNWLHIDLKGEFSNTDGIGAKVELTTGSDTQYRTVTANTGLMGQNSLIVEFGLGTNTIVDNIKVTWPSGTVKELFDVEVNQLIEIDDSNAPTNLGLSNAVLPENLSSGAAVGASFTVDIDSDDKFTYEIVTDGGGIPGGANKYNSIDAFMNPSIEYSRSSAKTDFGAEYESSQVLADGDNFFIENGTIKASTNFDFETQSSYSVRVRTTDAFGNTFEKVIQIDILDVNEEIENSAPTDITLTASRMAENEPSSSILGTLSANDSDEGSTHTFSLVDGDASLFQIDGNTLMTTESFNFEKRDSYKITIRTIDDGGLSLDKEYTISVEDVNEEPIELFLTNTELTEGLVSGSLVGLLSTVDTDNNDTHTYTLSGTDASSFQILGNELLTLDPLDFETKTNYDITITSTDAGGLSLNDDFSIEILNENDAPAELSISDTSIAEELPRGSVVATLGTTDDDITDTHTYSVSGTDAASFKIILNELRTAEKFNFEDNNEYEVTLTVTDNGGLSYSSDLTIGVNDVNDAPTSLSLSNAEIPEELAAGTIIGSLSTLDEDVSDTHTFTFATGTGSDDNASFSIDGTTLKSAEQFDFETKTSYSILLNVSDGNGGNFEAPFTIEVGDIDEVNPNSSPTNISLTATSILENESAGSTVGTLSTIDSDTGDSHTYTLINGDASLFSIKNSTLETSASFDFESINSYSLTIRSTDAGGLIFDQEFTISIDNVNEAPNSLEITNKVLAEGLTAGTAIGLLSTTDDDAGDTHTYAVSGSDASNFTFVNNELQSTVAFDFESQASYGITITVSDAAGLSYNEDFIISVSDENEAPTDVTLDNNSISEGLSSGTVVGSLTTSDADANDNQTYTLSGADASNFRIVINEIRSAEAFDFEAKPSYDVTITSTDKGGLTHSTDINIAVVDVNEAPTSISIDKDTVAEDVADGSVIGTMTVVDEDASDTHQYSISGIDAANFTFVNNELQSVGEFNFEVKSNYNITIVATDAGGLSIVDDFVVSISNVNEAPTDLSIAKEDVNEGTAIGTVVGLIDFEDQDVGDTHTLSLSGTDASSFEIDGAEVKSVVEFNFEEKSSFVVTATVTDEGGLNTSLDFNINILDVNEAPTAIELSNSDIKEKEDIGTVIGMLTVTDEDVNDTHTFTVLGDDAASFQVIGNELQSAESFDVTLKSSYSITIEAFDGELSTQEDFTITVTVPTGFDDDDRLVKVYPNPSNGIFTIALDKSWTSSEWKLFDLKGNLVYVNKDRINNSGSSILVDVTNLPTGEYILKLINANRQITKQIIITR